MAKNTRSDESGRARGGRREVPGGGTALAEALTPVFPSGLSVQTTHKWATGQGMPSADRIKQIAKWLKVSPHWLEHGALWATMQRRKKKRRKPSSYQTICREKAAL